MSDSLEVKVQTCVDAVSKEIMDICLPLIDSTEKENLRQSVEETAQLGCMSFFEPFSSRPPSQWTPTAIGGAAKVVFAQIMKVTSRGEYTLICGDFIKRLSPEEPISPEGEEIILFSAKNRWVNSMLYYLNLENPITAQSLLIHTMVVFALGGMCCYFFGSSRVFGLINEGRGILEKIFMKGII